jgi:biopolymer transport protein ExbD
MSRKLGKASLPRPELNITAMMDLVLNLIAFFVLISNFATNALPTEIEPPHPERSLAKPVLGANRVTVNIVPAVDGHDKSTKNGLAMEVVVGDNKCGPADHAEIKRLLTKETKNDPTVQVDLRADKGLFYNQVQPVMEAIAAAGVTKVNIVALVNE